MTKESLTDLRSTRTRGYVERLEKIADAAEALVDHGREWIGGTKYCPECMAEGWHYEGCKSGQEVWDLRKALEDAVHSGE